MRPAVACWLAIAACAAAPGEPPVASSQAAAVRPADDPAVAWTMRELGGSVDDERARASLEQGLRPRDLQYAGFDQVPLEQCIDRVLVALAAARVAGHDDPARARLAAEAAWFVRVRRDFELSRCAGAASCLPDVR